MGVPSGFIQKLAKDLLRRQAHLRTTTSNMADTMGLPPDHFMRDVPTLDDLIYRARLSSSELSEAGGMRLPRQMKNTRSMRHLEEWMMDVDNTFKSAGPLWVGGRPASRQELWDLMVRELKAMKALQDPDDFVNPDDIFF